MYEPQLGTRYARERGLQEATYSLVGFVDDDNWIKRDWVATAYEIMSSDRKLGALSSIRIPVSDVPLPSWFDQYHGAYGILTDQQLEFTPTPPLFLPTGGLCVRVEAWRELVESGFRSQLAGRVGRDFSGGEDTELTIALRFRGWKLEINPRLRLRHFYPSTGCSGRTCANCCATVTLLSLIAIPTIVWRWALVCGASSAIGGAFNLDEP